MMSELSKATKNKECESYPCVLPELPGFNIRGTIRNSKTSTVKNRKKSRAPVSQLVNADDTSVIEIKTQLYLES